MLTALISGEREKRRAVALSVIPPRMVEAVLAIEDRRFYAHPGVDPIGMVGALFSYATGRRAYLAGGSTITQQLVRNVFLPKFEGMTLQSARARSVKRKMLEIIVSLVLSRRASKDDILEMYLNDIPLGQRGSFAIFGVAEASRLFFGEGRQQPVGGGSGHDCRRHPVAVRALAVQQPAPLQGSAQRRSAGDGRRGLHHPGGRGTRRA